MRACCAGGAMTDRLKTTLRIGAAQMSAFEAPMRRRFEQQLVEHIRQYHPEQHSALSTDEVLEAVRYGIRRAAAHGITREQDITRFVDVMMVLGRDFDDEPRLPWAKQILQDESLGEPGERLGELVRAALAFLRNMAGPPPPRRKGL